MLQISDEGLSALIENDHVWNQTTNLKDVYPKVGANIAEEQER